ncbi:MAG: hypothetical protein WAJ85_07555 [Candidatus Baltobacteraceae bacterium]|jgi:hypothetical protein
MSFLEGLGKMAEGLLGGGAQAGADPLAGVDPQQAAAAAADHVQSLDPSELAGHLTQSVGSLDASSLSGLGQTLLQTFTNHASFQGDGAAAAQAAGTDAQAVASGSPNAISALISYAQSNPAVLQSAAGSFLQNNPSAIGQLSPGFLSGILGRLGGSA